MSARARMGFLALLKGLMALCLLAAAPAHAQEAQLRGDLSVGEASDWTWMTLREPAVLRDMPAGWQLLVDQVRFEKIAVSVTTTDGSVQRQILGAGQLGDN